MSSTSSSASYVYAIARDPDLGRLAALSGVADRPVRPVPAGDLVALVSTVDLAEFDEEALRRNLEDLTWVETVARAHHHVVEEAAGAGPVVPFRLATVYLDDGRVVAELDRRQAELTACLDRLDGRTEWSVKVLWEASAEPSDAPAPDEPGRPGTAFLLRRKAARSGYRREREVAQEQAEGLYDELVALSATSRRYPPQPGQLTGEVREMLLNAAYLVDGAQPDALAAVLTRYEDGPLHCELGGPWAPYSFATLDEEET